MRCTLISTMLLIFTLALLGTSCPQGPASDEPLPGDPQVPGTGDPGGVPGAGVVTLSASTPFVVAGVPGQDSTAITATLPAELQGAISDWAILSGAPGTLVNEQATTVTYRAPATLSQETDVVIAYLTRDAQGVFQEQARITIRLRTATFDVQLQAPKLTVTAGEQVTFSALASGGVPDAATGNYTFFWEGPGDNNTTQTRGPVAEASPSTFTWTAPQLGGTKVIRVTVTDSSSPPQQIIREVSVNVTATIEIADVTSDAANGGYNAGDVIDIKVVFSKAVVVTGTPLLTLETGATDRQAVFISGSGTDTLVFRYTVQAGDNSPDLDYAATSALTLPTGASIADVAGNAAVLVLPIPGLPGSLGFNKALVVDTTTATVTSVTSSTTNGTYGVGGIIDIQVNFSEPVFVAGGVPRLILNTGDADDAALFVSGSGTSTLSFTYTVEAGDATGDLDYLNTTALILPAGVSLTDVGGNPVNAALPVPGAAGSLSAGKAIIITTVGPVVTNVTSSTPNGSYNAGQTIDVQVTFSKPVLVASGSPALLLETGVIDRTATFLLGGGSDTLVFRYIVQAGDASGDLDYVSTGALAGGTITDQVGNPAVLTLPAPGPGSPGSLSFNQNIEIDTGSPAIMSITSTTPDGSYNAGDAINVTVTFSEEVTLAGGNLNVTLDTGAVVAITPFADSTTASGTYTVGAGQNSADLDAINIALGGAATLQDDAGNDASVILPGTTIADGSNIVVDTTAPTITSITSTTPDGSFNAGDAINVTVNFSEPVTLAGSTLNVTLDTGVVVNIAPFGPANTVSGTYTVGAGQNSADLDATNIALGGGATLRDPAGNDTTIALPATTIADGSNIVVDTTAPTITSITSTTPNGSFNAGDAINVTVNFSEQVTLAGGSLNVTLDTGVVVNIAPFGPANTAAGTYTVGAGQNSADLDATNIALGGGATLRDAAGNDATVALPGTTIADGSNIVVDTTAPTITSITSTTPDGSYNAGDAINVTVNFSEPVTLAGGNLLVTLDTGEVVNITPFGPANTASGTYTVGAGQNSADLDATNIALGGGATLRDVAGNDATVALPATTIADGSDIVVDTTAATITSITSTTPDGSYNAGDAINVTVSFSEPVTLAGGNLQVTLDTGVVVNITPFGPANTASGTYTVGAGQNSADLDATNVALAGGATLRDAADNDVTVALPATTIADGSNIVVDTTAPTITSITSSTPDGAYNAGDPINVTVNFSEPVTLAGGNLQVTLDTGVVVDITPFGPANTASGTYTVGGGENSADLDATNIALGGGATLRDAAGNDATVALPATTIADGSDIVVDTTAPTITSITSPDLDGNYVNGQTLTITVNFSEPVTLAGGTLDLTLNTAGPVTVSIVAFGPSASASVAYLIGAETSADLDVTNAVLNGGTLQDAAGNAVNLALPVGNNLADNKDLAVN